MATHNSPDGHPVEKVTGSAGDIESRGTQIVQLGSAMQSATSLLSRLVESGAEMEGEAVDKLKEAAKEVYSELGKAASLYESVGPYVRDYGSVLGTVQSLMDSSVPAAEQAWSTYQSRLGDFHDAQSAPISYPSGTEPSDDGSARQDAENAHESAVGEAEGAKDDAYALWVSAGDTFDRHYKQWNDAYDAAVTGIRSENASGIEDDWKDDLDGFVDFALDVLAVAGVVLAVLALVVGGPIVALIALGVGVLALAGTLYQYGRGDAELWEVGLAVLGVLPFGAIGEFASGGFSAGMRAWAGLGRGGLSLGDDAARWGLSLGSDSVGAWVNNMRTLGPEAGFLSSAGDLMPTIMSGQDSSMWDVIGQLATGGEQAAYAFGAVGSHYNTIVTGIGGVQGVVELVTNPDRILYPTW